LFLQLIAPIRELDPLIAASFVTSRTNLQCDLPLYGQSLLKEEERCKQQCDISV
jgi:hypothetical protein